MAPVKEYLWRDSDADEADRMEFRLTYAGPLRPHTGRSEGMADHKQELRQHFHPQLRRLWERLPHIQTIAHPVPPPGTLIVGERGPLRIEQLATEFSRNDYRFVPLVTKDLALSCEIDILFLRPEPPGGLVRGADIDNRIKTLFDALKMPGGRQDLGRYTAPLEGENPFYCLLEDDILVTALAVETDVLLEHVGDPPRGFDARLVITVNLRLPYPVGR